MARQARGWDGVRAWRFIRASKAYRDAWARRRPQPGLPERQPFPVRLRADADAAAMAWGMLALEDPHAERPLAPFWAGAGVAGGLLTHDMPPLLRLAEEGGAEVSGLRLDDGALMLRIEGGGRSRTVRLDGVGAFPEDAGLRLLLPRDVAAIDDVWAGAPAPRPGRARGKAGTARWCWRWNARRRGSRRATTRSASGSRSRSRSTTTPTAGWTSA